MTKLPVVWQKSKSNASTRNIQPTTELRSPYARLYSKNTLNVSPVANWIFTQWHQIGFTPFRLRFVAHAFRCSHSESFATRKAFESPPVQYIYARCFYSIRNGHNNNNNNYHLLSRPDYYHSPRFHFFPISTHIGESIEPSSVWNGYINSPCLCVFPFIFCFRWIRRIGVN